MCLTIMHISDELDRPRHHDITLAINHDKMITIIENNHVDQTAAPGRIEPARDPEDVVRHLVEARVGEAPDRADLLHRGAVDLEDLAHEQVERDRRREQHGEFVDGDAVTLSIATQPANGSATITGGSTLRYTPNLNFNGSDSVRVRASDGTLGAETTLPITIAPVNDAPTCSPTSIVTDEDTPGTATISCSDVDGDPLVPL